MVIIVTKKKRSLDYDTLAEAYHDARMRLELAEEYAKRILALMPRARELDPYKKKLDSD